MLLLRYATVRYLSSTLHLHLHLQCDLSQIEIQIPLFFFFLSALSVIERAPVAGEVVPLLEEGGVVASGFSTCDGWEWLAFALCFFVC